MMKAVQARLVVFLPAILLAAGCADPMPFSGKLLRSNGSAATGVRMAFGTLAKGDSEVNGFCLAQPPDAGCSLWGVTTTDSAGKYSFSPSRKDVLAASDSLRIEAELPAPSGAAAGAAVWFSMLAPKFGVKAIPLPAVAFWEPDDLAVVPQATTVDISWTQGVPSTLGHKAYFVFLQDRTIVWKGELAYDPQNFADANGHISVDARAIEDARVMTRILAFHGIPASGDVADGSPLLPSGDITVETQAIEVTGLAGPAPTRGLDCKLLTKVGERTLSPCPFTNGRFDDDAFFAPSLCHPDECGDDVALTFDLLAVKPLNAIFLHNTTQDSVLTWSADGSQWNPLGPGFTLTDDRFLSWLPPGTPPQARYVRVANPRLKGPVSAFKLSEVSIW